VRHTHHISEDHLPNLLSLHSLSNQLIFLTTWDYTKFFPLADGTVVMTLRKH